MVYDTNVMVPGLVGARRVPPGQAASVVCVYAMLRGAVDVVYSEPLLAELLDVLQRPQFGMSPRRARALVDFVRRSARVVPIPGRLHVLTIDGSDNHVLETAVVGKADYLITANLKHYGEADPHHPKQPKFRGVSIMRVGPYLRALQATDPVIAEKIRPPLR